MRRVNIGLTDEQHRRAKLLSVLLDQPLNDFLSQAIEEHIKKHHHKLRGLS